jgi:excisionase family DNA binding protein
VSAIPDTALTLQEAAEHLGVHYMTAYRYVRLGVLPAHKVGGAWQVAAADLASFREGSELAPAPEPGVRRRAPWATRLEARLVAGDSRGAWGVVEAALAAGADLDEIYLEVISPAMRSIGSRWADGELDISVEHRATGIAFRLLGRLGPRFARRGRSRGTVVLGAPMGERHSLPVAMLSDLLRGEGWEVSDLGADLPAASFVGSVLSTPGLVAVGVSVTSPESLPSAAALIEALHVAVPTVPVVVGGAAVQDHEHALALGATGWASSAVALAALLTDGSGQPVGIITT